MDLPLRTMIQQAEFKETFRGYDRNQVDDFLEQVAARVVVLEQGQTPGATPAPPAGGRAEPDRGDRVDEPSVDTVQRMLVLAQRTGDAAIAEAREEAARLVAGAHEEASAIVAGAQEEAAQVMADAQDEMVRLQQSSAEEHQRQQAEAERWQQEVEQRRERQEAEVQRWQEEAEQEHARLRAEVQHWQQEAEQEHGRLRAEVQRWQQEAEQEQARLRAEAQLRQQEAEQHLERQRAEARAGLIAELADLERSKQSLHGEVRGLAERAEAQRLEIRDSLERLLAAVDEPIVVSPAVAAAGADSKVAVRAEVGDNGTGATPPPASVDGS